jgi:hypothetical protein
MNLNCHEEGKMSIASRCILILFILILSLGLTAGAAQASLQNEAGFVTIAPVDFYFHYNNYFSRLTLHSSEAHIWYTFQAADAAADKTPVFVFFNGGPGSATTCGLMSMNTGRYGLDNTIDSGGGDHFIANPNSWTKLGHLLYIDARETGFSYNAVDNASDYMTRFREFNAQNFNPFFDAADFIRVLFRFLLAHPTLQNHPVVIVGESYGGIRATSMLYMLLNYKDFANDQEMYQDSALVTEIQSFYNTVFPDYSGRTVPPEVIAHQFGNQVLIDACISFGYQNSIQTQMLKAAGSPLYKIAAETGIPYDPSTTDPYDYLYDVVHRDVYNYTKPEGWLDNFFGNAAILLRYSQQLALITGADVRSVSGMYAQNRTNAYRILDLSTPAAMPSAAGNLNMNYNLSRALFLSPRLIAAEQNVAEPGDLASVFGQLKTWDRFYLSLNSMGNYAFTFFNVALIRGYEVLYLDNRFGRMFLKNLIYINTLATDGAYDLVVYGPALVPSLAMHTDIVQAATADPTPSRARQIVVAYRSDAFTGIQVPGSRSIYFPHYDKSCHSVPLTQPAELFTDVSAWLQANGVLSN